MRLLFATYSLAFQNPGGGERVLCRLKQGLEEQGHEVDLFDPWKTTLSGYAIIHYFSCIETSFWRFAKKLAPATPLIVTPTVNLPRGIRASAGRWKAGLLSWGARAIDPSQDRWRQHVLPDLWLPTTTAEAQGLHESWSVPEKKIRVLGNGVDERFFHATPELFRSKYRLADEFVLHVGRFHPVKNQLKLIASAGAARLPCVLIGNADVGMEAYRQQCMELARKMEQQDESGKARFLFIPAMDHDDPLLASAFAAARVFALPSQFETFGIAALEAAVAGAALVLTKYMLHREAFERLAVFVDPESPQELTAGLREAMKTRIESNEGKALRESLLSTYSWNKIVRDLVSAYETVLR